MSQHFRELCEFDQPHSQCRCADPGKTTIRISCDRPSVHSQMQTPRSCRTTAEVWELRRLLRERIEQTQKLPYTRTPESVMAASAILALQIADDTLTWVLGEAEQLAVTL